jgi:hypothetical protein
MMGGKPPPTIHLMSSTTRFTWLVLGAVAVTLVLAAATSAAMDSGNALPTLAHAVAIRATTGGERQPGGDGAATPPAAAVPAPQPTADVDRDEPEPEPGDDLDRDRGHVTTATVAQTTGDGRGPDEVSGSDDGHGSDGGGRDGGRG